MMARLMKDEARALVIWALVIAAALIWFWVSRGTDGYQLALGLLMSSVALFIRMALFEILWQVFADRRT
ncbi:MAG: hypothetical protein ACREDL_23600 [Bradyrhizobium sp.]